MKLVPLLVGVPSAPLLSLDWLVSQLLLEPPGPSAAESFWPVPRPSGLNPVASSTSASCARDDRTARTESRDSSFSKSYSLLIARTRASSSFAQNSSYRGMLASIRC